MYKEPNCSFAWAFFNWSKADKFESGLNRSPNNDMDWTFLSCYCGFNGDSES